MITKIIAAERQLDTAIKLFFEGVDYLSAYALATVSREITDDLSDKEEVKDYNRTFYFRKSLEILVKPELLKEFVNIIRKTQNFLKHADRDYDEQIDDISQKHLEYTLILSVQNYFYLQRKYTHPMITFLMWSSLKYPHMFDSRVNNLFDDNVNQIRELMHSMNEKEKLYLMLEHLRRVSPHLFPRDPAWGPSRV